MAIFGRLGMFSKAFYKAHVRGAMRSDARFPPGTLNLLRLPGQRRQDFILRRSRRLGPIFKIWLYGNHTTCIVGHQLGRRFLSENEGKVPLSTVNLKPEVPLGSIRSMEGEDHRKYRRLFLQAIKATPISLHAAEIQANMLIRLDRLSAEYRGRPISIKAFTPALRDISRDAMLLMFLGIVPEHPLYPRFCVEYDVLAEGSPAKIKAPQRAAFTNLRSLVGQILATRSSGAAHPACLLNYLADNDGTDETSLGNLIHFVQPSQFDTHCLWRWVVNYLSVENVYREMSNIAKGDAARFGQVSQSVVMETFRLNQAELLLRDIADDIVFEGFLFPKGSKLRVCIWEGHKNPALFNNPFQFTLDRFAKQSFGLDAYSPFGLDKHLCVGGNWVIDVSTLFVVTMVKNYVATQVANGPPVLGKYHWQPGKKLAVTLEKRAEPIG